MIVLPDRLVEILACPFCKSEVRVEETRIFCKNEQCGLVFPIRDGIPVFLIEEADKPCPACDGQRTFDFGADELSCPACGASLQFAPDSDS